MEHIIPYGLGDGMIFPRSSCDACRKATSKVEDFVLRRYLCALRSYLSLPSRKPGQRPDSYELTLRRGAQTWKRKVKIFDHPGVIQFIMFDPPGRVTGRHAEQETFSIRLVEAKIFSDWKQRLARLQADSAVDHVVLNAMALARMIAKIGHSFAIAELGYDIFEETYVNHLIKGASPDCLYWVGSYPIQRVTEASDLHQLKFIQRGQELSVIVHLFMQYCPSYAYEVVVGRLRPGADIPSALLLE